MKKEIIRTPEDRFLNVKINNLVDSFNDELEGYEGIRIHYYDNKIESDYTFLCLHGQPTWGYLYRKMVDELESTNQRIVIPDFIGFGKSDKLVDPRAYSFELHRNMLLKFVKKINLKNIILVCQDWGGILGLTLPMEFDNIFKKIIIMNTFLPTGERNLPPGFLDWRSWSAKNPDMNIGKLMKRSCPHLTEQDVYAYNAPFPDINYKAGVIAFPKIVPEEKNHNGASICRDAENYFLKYYEGDVFIAAGIKDPVFTLEVMKELKCKFKNISDIYKVEDAGHFVQEWGADVVIKALNYFKIEH